VTLTDDELKLTLREHAYLEGDFVLRSGRRSRYYLDKYRFETRPDTLAALASGLPFLIVRKAAKEYGTSNRVEGAYEQGDCVCLVEDVVTSGGALLAAIDALREAGLTVQRAVCVVDREEGGAEALAAAAVRLRAIFRASEIVAEPKTPAKPHG
jgi:orotate phosphoribosyltransferase